MRQCFIISQPRAGSTLLQRLLATHPQIQTVGEPWLAIPFVYALREKGLWAEYIHVSLAQGFGEFVSSLPGGRDEYFREAGDFLIRLQEKISTPGKTWFLDKTPRYHLILDELPKMFPDAKFIVLWRNPLAVAASILNTWKRGRFDIRRYEQDIYWGPENMLRFAKARAGSMMEIRFEDIVAGTSQSIRRVTDFLELPPLESVKLPEDDPLKQARMGDKTGINKFKAVSTAPVEEWKKTFASPLRRFWARRYLDFLGAENLRRMGYEETALRAALNEASGTFSQFWDDVKTLGPRLTRYREQPPFYPAVMKPFEARRGYN